MMNRRYVLMGGVALAAAALLQRFSGPDALAANSKKVFPIMKSEDEWRKDLTPEQFRVLREHGTERPGSSPLNAEKRAGTFVCSACEQPLFNSDTKYESGTGWPSFYAPIEGAIGTTEDNSLGMRRVEVHCSRCGGHLGHVFPDGPRPTGERYCMNGVSLKFVPKAA